MCCVDDTCSVQCFNAGIANASRTGEFRASYASEQLGRVFAAAFDSVHQLLYGLSIDGADGRNRGFTFAPDGSLTFWSPTPKVLAHRLTVTLVIRLVE